MSSGNPENSENPYAKSDSSRFIDQGRQLSVEGHYESGKVGHVFALGILMIVNGALELIISVYLIAMAVIFPTFLKQMQAQQPQMQDLPPNVLQWMQIGMGAIGGWMLFLGVGTIIAGIGTMRFRMRGFSITMLCLGFTSIVSIYCFPTSLALGIYGLIVLLNKPVKIAFEFGKNGFKGKEIQQAFARLPYDPELFEQMREPRNDGIPRNPNAGF